MQSLETSQTSHRVWRPGSSVSAQGKSVFRRTHRRRRRIPTHSDNASDWLALRTGTPTQAVHRRVHRTGANTYPRASSVTTISRTGRRCRPTVAIALKRRPVWIATCQELFRDSLSITDPTASFPHQSLRFWQRACRMRATSVIWIALCCGRETPCSNTGGGRCRTPPVAGATFWRATRPACRAGVVTTPFLHGAYSCCRCLCKIDTWNRNAAGTCAPSARAECLCSHALSVSRRGHSRAGVDT